MRNHLNESQVLRTNLLAHSPVSTFFCKANQSSSSIASQITCDDCGKEFCCKAHLLEHMQNHSHVEAFACVHCEKKFKWKSTLKYHLRKHLCQKQNHARSHSEEKLIMCKLCYMTYKHKSSLSFHMRQHLNESSSSVFS